MMALASFICAPILSAPILYMANWSELKDTMPWLPGMRKHKKSVPGTFLAFTNSPLAQSPMI